MEGCVFCEIVAGRSPASVVYRDESCIAFMDIGPINAGHLGQEVFHVHLHVLPRFRGDGFGHRFPPHYGQHPPREQLDAEANVIRKALEAA